MSPAELAGYAWVMEPNGTASRQWTTALCRTLGFEPDVRYESADLLFHVRLVESGHAAAVLPDLVWSGRPSLELRALPGEPFRTIFLATRSGADHHPAITAVSDALRRAGWSRVLP